jgi:hypothetical protein
VQTDREAPRAREAHDGRANLVTCRPLEIVVALHRQYRKDHDSYGPGSKHDFDVIT